MPSQSVFKNKKIFDANSYVITIFNAGNPNTGHAVLLVEGEDDAGKLLIYRCEIFAKRFKDYLQWFMEQNLRPGAPSSFLTLYRDYANVIRPIEDQSICYVVKKQYNSYPPVSRAFKDCASHSWNVTVANANNMLSGIDAEKREVDNATRLAIAKIQKNVTPDLSAFTLFKKYGHDSTLSPSPDQDNAGINCVNWCEKHLPNAGIAPASNVSDSFAAKPEWHANQAHCGPYS